MMGRGAVVLLAAGLAACGAPREPATAPAPPAPLETAIASVEPPPSELVPTPPPASAPAPAIAVSPPFDPPPCATDARPAEALDALMTPGNVHRYVLTESWHASLRGAPHVIEERVAEAVTFGPIQAARVEVRVLACLGTPEECAQRILVADALRLRRGEVLVRATDDVALPADARAARARFEEGLHEVPPGRAVRDRVCTRAGCGAFAMHRDRWSTEAWILPHVGLAVATDGSYSPETGDGSTSTRVLIGWALGTPVPAAPASPEPPGFAAERARFAEIAAGRDTDAIARLVHPRLQYSLHAEHRDAGTALEAWRADETAAWTRLEALLASPCGGVDGAVVCPAAEARPARASECAAAAEPSGPRALFVGSGGSWRLASFLAGGLDDLWVQPEWSSRPPRPFSQRERFLSDLPPRP